MSVSPVEAAYAPRPVVACAGDVDKESVAREVKADAAVDKVTGLHTSNNRNVVTEDKGTIRASERLDKGARTKVCSQPP